MPIRVQSALEAAGEQAARIEGLWWVLFWVCAVVWIAVMVALGLGVWRGLSGRATGTPSRRLGTIVGSATAVTVVVLIGLLAASALTGRALSLRAAPEALVIEVTAHQWWWKVEYVHPDPSLRVITANEIHIPTGRPVTFQLKSADVIHSFWIPNLHGKIDVVPGRLNTTWLSADNPGVFRGQCAEFCGLQHAQMGLVLVAHPPAEFEEWIAAQRRPAAEPATPEQARGREVVEQGPCGMCHTVRGTLAGGRTAPDLTHVASRQTIAAGTLPNTRGHLGSWLANPQQAKPGSRMPATGLSAADLQALLAYLEALR